MKQVHWQLPFASLDGTQYRIDIYSDADENENANWPIQLVGCATPFTTDEDNSDDFFAPVRSQTGCINIIDEDGTLMESGIMPSDNVDKPVRLIRVSDGAVMWQGFLSCETYSQAYTSRPNEVTLNVNSVLEAMESVRIRIETGVEFAKIRHIVFKVLEQMQTDAGISLFDKVYYPIESEAVMSKIMNMSNFYDMVEQSSESKITYSIEGMSIAEILRQICVFMGWTMRERGRDIYMTLHQTEYGVERKDYLTFDSPTLGDEVEYDIIRMQDNNYMGTDHSISTTQGAEGVEVIADVKEYELGMDVPPCPTDGLEGHTGSDIEKEKGGAEIMFMEETDHGSARNNITFGNIAAECKPYFDKDHTIGARQYHSTSHYNVVQNLAVVKGVNCPAQYNMNVDHLDEYVQYYAGAFLCRVAFTDTVQRYYKTKEGLYLSLFPGMLSDGQVQVDFDATRVVPILTMRSVLYKSYFKGYLHIDAAIDYLVGVFHSTEHPSQLTLTLRIGNDYWNGSDWQGEECTFVQDLAESNWTESMPIEKVDGPLIPLGGLRTGEVEIKIWPQSGVQHQLQTTSFVTEMFLSKFTIEYIYEKKNLKTDASQNVYYQKLDKAFTEKVTINSDIASDMFNIVSPSIILDALGSPADTVIYKTGEDTSEYRRPEKDLLRRMAAYYKQPRTQISLEVDRPTAPLPLVRIKGYDRKTYLPLSESRDWKMGVSTIRCFECPE